MIQNDTPGHRSDTRGMSQHSGYGPLIAPETAVIPSCLFESTP
jgi:hypothetical protein